MTRGKPLVVHVTGARPNYAKIAPIHQVLAARGRVDQALIHTGQHYDELLRDSFFRDLPLPPPTRDLAVGSGTHAEQTARALIGLEAAFLELRPDVVIVPGDVNSTLAAGLAAAKLEIPVVHVEAGLRSFDRSMPEEHNRVLVDHLSTLLLTHSASASANLAAEGIPPTAIELVGNTMIDTLLAHVEEARSLATWKEFGVSPGEFVLVTLHRPALVDSRALLQTMFEALERVAEEIPVIFPAHPRTLARIAEGQLTPRSVKVVPPLAYGPYLSLQAAAGAVITDSGGVQEETTVLGVRCFTLRANTERPITVELGTNTVLGLDPSRVLEVPRLLGQAKTSQIPPLWDGKAGGRAAIAIERLLGIDA